MLPSRAAPVLPQQTASSSTPKVHFTVYDLDEEKRYKVFLLSSDLPRLRVLKIRRTLCATVPALTTVSFRLFSTIPDDDHQASGGASPNSTTHHASYAHSSGTRNHHHVAPLPLRCLEDDEVGAMFGLEAGTVLALQRESQPATAAAVRSASEVRDQELVTTTASSAAVNSQRFASSPLSSSPSVLYHHTTSEGVTLDFSPVPTAPTQSWLRDVKTTTANVSPLTAAIYRPLVTDDAPPPSRTALAERREQTFLELPPPPKLSALRLPERISAESVVSSSPHYDADTVLGPKAHREVSNPPDRIAAAAGTRSSSVQSRGSMEPSSLRRHEGSEVEVQGVVSHSPNLTLRQRRLQEDLIREFHYRSSVSQDREESFSPPPPPSAAVHNTKPGTQVEMEKDVLFETRRPTSASPLQQRRPSPDHAVGPQAIVTCWEEDEEELTSVVPTTSNARAMSDEIGDVNSALTLSDVRCLLAAYLTSQSEVQALRAEVKELLSQRHGPSSLGTHNDLPEVMFPQFRLVLQPVALSDSRGELRSGNATQSSLIPVSFHVKDNALHLLHPSRGSGRRDLPQITPLGEQGRLRAPLSLSSSTLSLEERAVTDCVLSSLACGRRSGSDGVLISSETTTRTSSPSQDDQSEEESTSNEELLLRNMAHLVERGLQSLFTHLEHDVHEQTNQHVVCVSGLCVDSRKGEVVYDLLMERAVAVELPAHKGASMAEGPTQVALRNLARLVQQQKRQALQQQPGRDVDGGGRGTRSRSRECNGDSVGPLVNDTWSASKSIASSAAWSNATQHVVRTASEAVQSFWYIVEHFSECQKHFNENNKRNTAGFIEYQDGDQSNRGLSMIVKITRTVNPRTGKEGQHDSVPISSSSFVWAHVALSGKEEHHQRSTPQHNNALSFAEAMIHRFRAQQQHSPIERSDREHTTFRSGPTDANPRRESILWLHLLRVVAPPSPTSERWGLSDTEQCCVSTLVGCVAAPASTSQSPSSTTTASQGGSASFRRSDRHNNRPNSSSLADGKENRNDLQPNKGKTELTISSEVHSSSTSKSSRLPLSVHPRPGSASSSQHRTTSTSGRLTPTASGVRAHTRRSLSQDPPEGGVERHRVQVIRHRDLFGPKK